MTFAGKIGNLMQRPTDDLVPKDEVPWWLRYSARGLGTISGGMGVFLGVFNVIADTLLFRGFSCIFSGIWLSLASFSIIVFEAPCCCLFIDFVQDASNWMEKRPHWNKAAYYMGIVVPVFSCFSTSKFLSCVLIFCTGLLYGMMALGKKGTRADMAAVASPTDYISQNTQADHHRNLMEDPDVWRPA